MSNTGIEDAAVEDLGADDMLPEYDLDYARSTPNRFARRESTQVMLEAPVADYLRSKAADKGVPLDALVNDLLRRDIDLIEAVK
jgi:hypothetical protein